MFPKRPISRSRKFEARDAIALRVWERGVGVTLGCGSAACATLVAAARLGLTGRKARIALPGGELTIEWRDSDDHVLMTGPVEFEREITLDDSLFEAAGAEMSGGRRALTFAPSFDNRNIDVMIVTFASGEIGRKA